MSADRDTRCPWPGCADMTFPHVHWVDETGPVPTSAWDAVEAVAERCDPGHLLRENHHLRAQLEARDAAIRAAPHGEFCMLVARCDHSGIGLPGCTTCDPLRLEKFCTCWKSKAGVTG